MRALVHDPSAPHGLLLAEAPDPAPSPSQIVVEVHASSLNFGELTFMAERHPPGHVAGKDAAGVVVAAAADDSGPAVRTRVVCFAGVGAGAELLAVDVRQVAELPFGDLVALLRVDRLDPQVGWRGSWERVAEAADALRERRLVGKAVLDIVSDISQGTA